MRRAIQVSERGSKRPQICWIKRSNADQSSENPPSASSPLGSILPKTEWPCASSIASTLSASPACMAIIDLKKMKPRRNEHTRVEEHEEEKRVFIGFSLPPDLSGLRGELLESYTSPPANSATSASHATLSFRGFVSFVGFVIVAHCGKRRRV